MPNKDKPKDTFTMVELRQTPLYRQIQHQLARLPYDDLSPRGQQTARPASLLDQTFVYVPSNKTDVRATWARFGFKPKGE